MEKSTKTLLKHIIDIDIELQKIGEIFQNKDFLPVTKLYIDIGYDALRLILKAFDLEDDDIKGEKMFNLFNDLYEKKISAQDIVDEIEKILEQ